jgi:hypothetical protein
MSDPSKKKKQKLTDLPGKGMKCIKCSDLINLDSATTTTFTCGDCSNKSCGQHGYEKRVCTPSQTCSGCARSSATPAYAIIIWRIVGCVAEDLRHTVKHAKASATSLAICDLCGFTICQHHGKECAKCSMKTCGIHDCGPRACDGCKKTSYCERCAIFYCCPCEPCMVDYCTEGGRYFLRQSYPPVLQAQRGDGLRQMLVYRVLKRYIGM